MRRGGVVLGLTLGVATLLRVVAGCSAEAGVTPAPRPDDSGAPRQARDASVSDQDASEPPSIDGWDAWNDYDSTCAFFTRSKDRPLPPLAWEPCAPTTDSNRSGCRQIKITWAPPRTFGVDPITPATTALKHSDGTVALMTSREEDGDIVRTLVDVDGPVLQAFRERADRCTLTESPSFGDHYVYKINDSAAKGKLSGAGGGALGGKLSERPRVLARFPDQVDRGYVAGEPGFVITNSMEVRSWTDGGLVAAIAAPDDASLYFSEFAFVGSTFFWNAGSLSVSRQRVWSLSAGTSALLTAGDDATRAYGDSATDGV